VATPAKAEIQSLPLIGVSRDLPDVNLALLSYRQRRQGKQRCRKKHPLH